MKNWSSALTSEGSIRFSVWSIARVKSMPGLLFVRRNTLFRRLSGLCRNARTDAAGALCGDACRGCTVGYRDRCSECQLSYGPDRASGQSLEVSIRRAESGGRAAVFLALQGGRQLFSRDSRPYHQRRQCRRSRGDRLRQCRGNAGFHHGNAWNRVGIGIRCRRSDDLRARWHGRRAGACRCRTRRTAMRLRTPWLSGNLCFCDGCQTDGLRVDGPGNGAERFTRCTLRQVRRPDNYRSGAKGDSLALEVFRCTAERLGRALANAVAITSSEAVFFFGGLAQAGELLLEPTRRYLEENLLPVYRGNVKVLPSGIPAQNAAILGASALIWNE